MSSAEQLPFRQTLQAELVKVKTELAERSQECSELVASHAALKITMEGTEKELKTCRDALAEAQREVARLRDSQVAAVSQQAETLSNGTREADYLKTTISNLESEVEGLRLKLEEAVRGKEEALAACRSELTSQHEAAATALVQSHQADKQAALTALEERLLSDAATKESALREELTSAHEVAVKALLAIHADQLEAALRSLRVELESSYSYKEHALREELALSHGKEIAELNASAARSLEAALEAAKFDLKSAADRRESEIRMELQTAHSSAMESMKVEFESQLAEAVAKVRQEAEDQRIAELEALAQQKRTELEEALAAAERRFRDEVEVVSKERDAALLRASEAINELETRVRQAVSIAESRKDAEKVAALSSLREELQSLVDSANAERDEFFKLYSKVMLHNIICVLCIYTGIRRGSSER